MLEFSENDLKITAEKMLDMHPDPIPRFRLLRDVIELHPADAVYREAERGIAESSCFALLQQTQQADGTWGRFHTQSSRLKQAFPTTEAAITVALHCGLDKHSPILDKARGRIVEYVDGNIIWPDRPEKHDNPLAWNVWVRHFSAAVLAQIDRHEPRLNEFWNIWAEALQASFESGVYDRQREIQALNQLLGCRMKNPVPFHRKYPLLILSATDQRLPESLERRMLDFVLHSAEGIYYIYNTTLSTQPVILSRGFWGWLQAHRLLSRFHLWRELAEQAVNWIWAQRTAQGFWDLGSKAIRKPYSGFPLSESWRRSENRVIDSTVEILSLLCACFR